MSERQVEKPHWALETLEKKRRLMTKCKHHQPVIHGELRQLDDTQYTIYIAYHLFKEQAILHASARAFR